MNCLPTTTTKKNVVIVYGRFQPPTIGHGILIHKMEQKMIEEDADGYICLSKSVNTVPESFTRKGNNISKYGLFSRNARKMFFSEPKENRNPLTANTRIKFLRKMYPTTSVKFINGETCDYTPIKFVNRLKEIGYEDITILVGSDRASSFSDLGANVWVEKVGDVRTSDFRGHASGMSGTLMRKAAFSGNYELFKQGCKIGLMTDDDVKELMDSVRMGLGFNSSIRRVRINKRRNEGFVWPEQVVKTRTRKNKTNSSGANVV